MDLHGQPASQPATAEAEVLLLQKIRLKVNSARDSIEDFYLSAEIPQWIRKHLTFYRLHVIYFLFISIWGTLILYIAHRSDAGERHFSMVDSIFNVVSVVTVTGMSSVRIADLSLFDLILFMVLMTLGSPAFTSLIPLCVRRFYFFRRHRTYEKDRQKQISLFVSSLKAPKLGVPRQSLNPSENPDPQEDDRIMVERSRDAASASASTSAATVPWFSDKPLFISSPGRHSNGSMGNAGGQARRSSLEVKVEIVRAFDRPQSGSDQLRNGPRFSDRPLFITSPRHSMGNAGGQAHQCSLEMTLDIVRAFDRPQSGSDQHPKGRENQVLRRKEVGSEEVGQPCGPPKPPQGAAYPGSALNIMRTIEHQGLVVLSWLIPVYIVVCQLVPIAISMVILSLSPPALKILSERKLSTFFFSSFTAVASFTNSGVPASDDNMVPFQSQYALLMLYTLVSLAGNLLYPACLRLVIWILHILASGSKKPVYGYLLNHPRSCFTHLFPPKQTVWLCLTLIGFTGLQVVCFCALDWHSNALTDLSPIAKIVDGIYQSVSVRSAGGDVVNISELATSMLVLYLFMMFIAAYPVALLKRNSAEHDFTDIGIYDKRWEQELTDNSITFQSRKMFAKDSAYLCVILFAICLVESKNIEYDPLNYSVFNIIFEVVSAYGGVGMSVGYSCSLRLRPSSGQPLGPCTDVPYSFSGKWSSAGKLILAIAMFMGRHRGLPDDIDSAIKLPHFKESSLLSSRRNSTAGPGGTPRTSSPGEQCRPRRKSLDETAQGVQPPSRLAIDSQSDSGVVDGLILKALMTEVTTHIATKH